MAPSCSPSTLVTFGTVLDRQVSRFYNSPRGGGDILRTHVPGVETTFAISGAVFTNFTLTFLHVIVIGIVNRITTAVFYFFYFLHNFIAKQIFPNSVIYVYLKEKKGKIKTAVVILLEIL